MTCFGFSLWKVVGLKGLGVVYGYISAVDKPSARKIAREHYAMWLVINIEKVL